MTNKIKKNKLVIKDYLFTFLISFCAIILKICTTNSYTIGTDQIGTLATASKLAGLEWDVAISHAKYYGFGYYWIYSILFKLTDNPHVIVYVHYFIVAILISLVSCLILHMAVNLLDMKKTKLLYFVPTVIAFETACIGFATIINSPIVYCVVWLAIYYLIKAYKEKDTKKRVLFSIASSVFFVYILYLHETVVALYIALFVAFILVRIIWKEWIADPRVFGTIMICGVVSQRVIRNGVINSVWLTNSAGELNNTSAFQTTSLWFLENKTTLKIFIDVVISNFLNLNERTFGLVSVAICFAVWCLIKNLFKKGDDENTEISEKICFILSVISLCSAAIIILGLGASWGRRAYQVYIGANGLSNEFRGYAYPRYFMPYFTPGILAMIAYLSKIEKKSKIICVSILISLFAALYYLLKVHTYYFEIWGMSRMAIINVIQNDIYGANVIISIFLPLIMLILWCINKNKIARNIFISVSFIMGVVMSFATQTFSIPEMNDDTYVYYELIKELEENNLKVYEGYTTSSMICRFQFIMQNIELKEITTYVDEKESIIFLRASDEQNVLNELRTDGFKKIRLNEMYEVLFKGERYEDIINQLDFEVVEISYSYGTE